MYLTTIGQEQVKGARLGHQILWILAADRLMLCCNGFYIQARQLLTYWCSAGNRYSQLQIYGCPYHRSPHQS